MVERNSQIWPSTLWNGPFFIQDTTSWLKKILDSTISQCSRMGLFISKKLHHNTRSNVQRKYMERSMDMTPCHLAVQYNNLCRLLKTLKSSPTQDQNYTMLGKTPKNKGLLCDEIPCVTAGLTQIRGCCGSENCGKVAACPPHAAVVVTAAAVDAALSDCNPCCWPLSWRWYKASPRVLTAAYPNKSLKDPSKAERAAVIELDIDSVLVSLRVARTAGNSPPRTRDCTQEIARRKRTRSGWSRRSRSCVGRSSNGWKRHSCWPRGNSKIAW